jgi:hypothetical protein
MSPCLSNQVASHIYFSQMLSMRRSPWAKDMVMPRSHDHKLLEREDWQDRVIAIKRVVSDLVLDCTTGFLGLLRFWFAGRQIAVLWVRTDMARTSRIQSSQPQILDSFSGTPDAVCSTLQVCDTDCAFISRVQVSSASVIAAIGDSCPGAFRRLTNLPIRLAQKHS